MKPRSEEKILGIKNIRASRYKQQKLNQSLTTESMYDLSIEALDKEWEAMQLAAANETLRSLLSASPQSITDQLKQVS